MLTYSKGSRSICINFRQRRNFRANKVIRDKEGNYILIQQEDITILNVNNSVLHILLKLTANIQQNHFLGHKAHFNKFKRIETLTVLFSPWGPSVQWLQIAVSLVVYATCCLYRLP